MADFLLSTLTGDLDFGENNSLGLQLTPDYRTEAEQRLTQALSLNLTEWFADITKGLPYIFNPNENLETNIRYFLGDKSPNAAQFVKATLDKYILDLPFITSLKSSYNFEDSGREFIYTYSVVANGEEINFPPITLNI
jgi:hypothetical protein